MSGSCLPCFLSNLHSSCLGNLWLTPTLVGNLPVRPGRASVLEALGCHLALLGGGGNPQEGVSGKQEGLCSQQRLPSGHQMPKDRCDYFSWDVARVWYTICVYVCIQTCELTDRGGAWSIVINTVCCNHIALLSSLQIMMELKCPQVDVIQERGYQNGWKQPC